MSSNAVDVQARGERLVRCGWCGVAGAVRLVRCSWCGAAGAVRMVRCGWCGAAGAVQLVRCGWCGAAGAVQLVRCGWCGAAGAVRLVRYAGVARLVRPNQLLPSVLLVIGTAGVTREVGMNNHHNRFPPPRWV